MPNSAFIPHCDDDCGLGSFQYECPNCKKNIVDYDIWWNQDDLYGGTILQFKCNICKQALEMKYNKDHTLVVSIIKGFFTDLNIGDKFKLKNNGVIYIKISTERARRCDERNTLISFPTKAMVIPIK